VIKVNTGGAGKVDNGGSPPIGRGLRIIF